LFRVNTINEHHPMTIRCPVNTCKAHREPLADYLRNREYVSSSQLRRFDRSGLPGWQLPDAGMVPGTIMGEALHALVLEPDAFSRRYLVLADAAGAQSVRCEQDLMRREWLDAWQWAVLSGARNALLSCRQAPVSRWLAAGRKELSIYWRDHAGAPWKARPDCFTDEIVLDLKTTSDCRPPAFGRTRERFGYDLQAAHYVDAVTRLTGKTPRFAFLAVELTAPYSVWLHELDGNEIDAASARLDELKRAYLAASKAVDDPRASPR
jgi:hypothetical protein